MSNLFNWEEILGQINLIQKKLQESDIGLNVCVTHMDATKIFFYRNSDRLASESVNQSKINSRKWKFQLKSGFKKKKKATWGKKEDDVCQTLVQKIKRNLFECHDRLVNEVDAGFDSISVFAGLSSQVILKDNEGELERKFLILRSEFFVDLNVSRLYLEDFEIFNGNFQSGM